jgi:hypothetical protein
MRPLIGYGHDTGSCALRLHYLTHYRSGSVIGEGPENFKEDEVIGEPIRFYCILVRGSNLRISHCPRLPPLFNGFISTTLVS